MSRALPKSLSERINEWDAVIAGTKLKIITIPVKAGEVIEYIAVITIKLEEAIKKILAETKSDLNITVIEGAGSGEMVTGKLG